MDYNGPIARAMPDTLTITDNRTGQTYEVPIADGAIKATDLKQIRTADETDTGLVGMGEACPLGNFYGPAYAAGVRAGIAELGPHLIGADPRQIAAINRTMDAALKGHPYVKSALDMACWDILGPRSSRNPTRRCDAAQSHRGTRAEHRRPPPHEHSLRQRTAPRDIRSCRAALSSFTVPTKDGRVNDETR